MTNPANGLFEEWTSQVRDLAVFSEIATRLSAGQRLDILRALFDTVDPDERQRMCVWLNDQYGTMAKLREAITKLRKKGDDPS